jgi:hypothetical protein
MSSTYSTNLRTELIGSGDQAGTWGTTTNTTLGSILEQAIAGVSGGPYVGGTYPAVNFPTDADITLTANNGSVDQSRSAVLVVTSSGSLTATRNVIAPASASKVYIIKNSTTGGQSIQIKYATGTGITVGNGATVLVYGDGTNFNIVANPNSVTGNLTVSGNTTLSGTLAVTGAQTNSSTFQATTITATTQFSGPGTGLTGTASSLSIGGNAATATTATTATTANALNTGNSYTVNHIQVNDGSIVSGNTSGSYATYRYDGALGLNGGTFYSIVRNYAGDVVSLGGLTVGNTVSCYPSDGYPDTHNKAMTNYDYRIGSWSVGSSGGSPYIQVFLDGSAYGISVFSSDARLKNNIADSNYNALNVVKQIHFKQFDWNEEKSIGRGHEDIGFISQDLQAIDSTLVKEIENHREPENALLQPNENKLLVIALKAIQELKEEVDSLKNELATLKG